MRVYLAGPDVFWPDPQARGDALKAICAEFGLAGVFPLDPLRGGVPPAWLALSEARRIALCNEAHIRASMAVIANLSPFRGPSADAGTVFEVGFARALGLPVFGWTTDPRPFTERTLAFLGGDGAGRQVEAFGCVDNLMIDGAITASGGALIVARDGEADLAVFGRCVARAAAKLGRGADEGAEGARAAADVPVRDHFQ